LKALKITAGVIGVLLAVFAGGCGLLYFGIGVMTAIEGRDDYGFIVISLLIGILPGAIGALVAWWAFK
jgi:hypothetical protein